MIIYLDASVLVALFTPDPLSERVDASFRSAANIPVISDFAAAEFASAVSRKVRMRALSATDGRAIFAEFDTWALRVTLTEMRAVDVQTATSFLRRLDLNLRAPDAINIAVAQRLGILLATFDDKMASVAQSVGVPVANL